MKIIPIGNSIIFTFVDRVTSKGEFERERTAGGLFLQSSVDDSAKSPRWVNVIATGPECKTIKPRTQVLLPNLRWTSNVKVGQHMVWRSDEQEAVAYRESATSRVFPLRNVVLFTQAIKDRIGEHGRFVIIGQSIDSASGNVVALGPDAESCLANTTIYYDDVNFTDTFTHAGTSLSFITDDKILAFM